MSRSRNGPPGVNEEPKEGLWYYVWLKPEWCLHFAFGQVGHVFEWRNTVVPALVKHYGLDNSQALAIRDLTYSMPRGRVVLDGNEVYIGHGNDFPAKTDYDDEMRRIVNEFELGRHLILGRVHVGLESHEKMNKRQQKAVQEVIGKVPY